MLWRAGMKIETVRARRVRFEFNRRPQLEACRLKAQRQPPASGKQIQQSRTPTRLQPCHFLADRVPGHHVAAFSEAGRVSSSRA
jgi:hypothetical protein